MRILKTCLSIFMISMLYLNSALADETSLYAQRLNTMIENGVISENEAEKHLVQLNSEGQNNFHKQVRGIASKMKEAKIYEIINEPLEIPVE